MIHHPQSVFKHNTTKPGYNQRNIAFYPRLRYNTLLINKAVQVVGGGAVFLAKITNVKHFMYALFTKEIFDNLELRVFSVVNCTVMNISGTLNKEFFGDEAPESDFCRWGMLRNIAYGLVKGTRPPKSMKVILSPDKKATESIDPKAAAFFMNIQFENGMLSLTGGVALKEFELQHETENAWDAVLKKFLHKNGIEYELC